MPVPVFAPSNTNVKALNSGDAIDWRGESVSPSLGCWTGVRPALDFMGFNIGGVQNGRLNGLEIAKVCGEPAREGFGLPVSSEPAYFPSTRDCRPRVM